jgi:hypothetical protein
MKKITLMLTGLTFTICSCASLSDSQIKAINSFANTTSNYSQYSNMIFKELSKVKQKNGLMYANKLINAENRIVVLDSIFSDAIFDNKFSKKIDLSFKLIDKYAQSLMLLSSDKHSLKLKENALKLGISIDSLTKVYNHISPYNTLPNNIGSPIGKIIALGGEQYVKYKQTKELKKFISKGDLLVNSITENLIDFFNSSQIDILIQDQERKLRLNYLAFNNGEKEINLNNSTIYLELRNKIYQIKKLNQEVITYTRSIKKTHYKLKQVINKKQKLTTSIKELQKLQQELINLKKTIKELK